MLILGLIGVGRWGTNILRTLETIPDCQVKYVCSTNPAELAPLKNRYTVLTRAQDLTKKNNLAGVLIATPASTHARIALPFIKKGVPIFIEKPMTDNLTDAHRLEKASQLTRRSLGEGRVFVGHIHLYNPAYQTAKTLARQAGKIRLLISEGANNGPFRPDVSALWDWAPHDIAIILDLLSEKPISLQAWGTAILRPKTSLFDIVHLKLHYPNDLETHVRVSWVSPEKRKKTTIIGAKNTIVFDDTKPTQKVTLYTNLGPLVSGPTITRQEPGITHPTYDETPPLKKELAAFLAMIRTKKPPLTDLQQGLDVVTILDAAERSIALSGQLVTTK